MKSKTPNQFPDWGFRFKNTSLSYFISTIAP